jgi:hypothetical protein
MFVLIYQGFFMLPFKNTQSATALLCLSFLLTVTGCQNNNKGSQAVSDSTPADQHHELAHDDEHDSENHNDALHDNEEHNHETHSHDEHDH